MSATLTMRGAVTAPGSRVNEDAYGIWPGPNVQAAWVLDGVTGINEHALLPGPTDAAWFVSQVQQILPRLLAAEPRQAIHTLLEALVAGLDAAQDRSWRDGMNAEHGETPAASFALARQIGDEIEIARLGDCPVLLGMRDGRVLLLDDPVLTDIEADLKKQVLALRARGILQSSMILREMLPTLRAVRRRRNRRDGYGVLCAEKACLDLLQLDRFPARDIRHLLLLSDGYYRLVDVYSRYDDAGLMHQTTTRGPADMLAELRAIEADDPAGDRHPRLKMADDATALLIAID